MRPRNSRSRSCGRRAALGLGLLAMLGAAVPAGAWDVDPSAPDADLEAFHLHFASAAYHYPRHAAKPLGVIGFEVFAELSYGPDFDEDGFAETAIAGDLTGGFLSLVRVGARKGLPGGFDLGAAYSQALEGDVELLSGDLQWALLEGGPLKPAFSFRLTYTQSVGDAAYDLEQIGVEALISKGFTVLTPFAGAGLVYSDGTFDRPGGAFLTDDSGAVLYAGVKLDLWAPELTFVVEQGRDLQAAIRLSFGL